MRAPILLVGAEAFEFAELLRRFEHRPLPGAAVRFARVGQFKDRELVVMADGPGPKRARHAVLEALNRVRPAEIWSIGICGALDPGLRCGDVVVASQIVDRATGERFDAEGGDLPVVSQDRVAATVEEKRRLREYGVAVEMEAAAVAREACRLGIPVLCFKAVSDTAGEEFGVDLNGSRDGEGRFRPERIVANALLQPLTRVPELFRLHRQSRTASNALGEFLVRRLS
ncbi:MAG: hypothetical protein SFV18_19660 [Bryobacteraceae bacterium]|nr:hypothetical protein [Bryobacteraceae bacterium]